MDPDVCLKEIREILAPEREWSPDDMQELADLVRGLDEWISKGGALPWPWAKSRISRPRT